MRVRPASCMAQPGLRGHARTGLTSGHSDWLDADLAVGYEEFRYAYSGQCRARAALCDPPCAAVLRISDVWCSCRVSAVRTIATFAGMRLMPTQGDAGQLRGAGGTSLGGTSLGALLRRHWVLAVLLAAGLVLRVMAQVAYRPALLYIDSIKYLYGAYPGDDPPGYLLVLKPFLAVGNLDLVAAVQHLLGLGMAVALYLLMRRRSVPRWLAALATAPILLDGYQLQNEQTIMPDTLFEALIVTGLVILL